MANDFIDPSQIAGPEDSLEFIDPNMLNSSDSLPEYADGLTADFPINESPLSIQDRLSLSLGDEAGKVKFLKENYGQVQKTESGDFVIKGKDGLWRRADATGLGNSDPWKMTKDIVSGLSALANPIGAAIDLAQGKEVFQGAAKEVASDVAENLPMAAAVGAQLGVAALTGGASLGAQAAAAAATGMGTKSIETILGRALGTYEASNEELLQDVAIEGLLNTGGTYVGAGIKVGMPYIAAGLQKTGEMLSKVNPFSRNMMTSLFGLNVPGGQRVVEHLVDRPNEVASWVKHAGKGTTNSVEAQNVLLQKGARLTEQAAKAAQPSLNNMHEVALRDVLKNVDQNFDPEIKKTVNSILQKFVEKGVAKQEVVRNAQGNIIQQGIRVKTLKEFTEEAAETGFMHPLAGSPEELALIEDFVNKLNSQASRKELYGIAGANQLLEMKRQINDLSFKAYNSAKAAGQSTAQRLLTQLKSSYDAIIYPKFDLKKPATSSVFEGETSDNLLRLADSKYTEAKKALTPLLQAVKAAERNPETWYNLYRNVNSQAGSNAKKLALEEVADYLSKYGGKEAAMLASNVKTIKDINAASNFIPNFKPSIISNVAVGGALGSALSGAPGIAVPMAASAVVTSPKLNYHLIKNFVSAKDFIGNLGRLDRMRFLNDPAAVSQFVSTVANAPGTRQQLSTELMRQGVGPLIERPQ